MWREGVKTGLGPGKQVFIEKPKPRGDGGIKYVGDRIHPNTMLFLADLKANNDREWLKSRSFCSLATCLTIFWPFDWAAVGHRLRFSSVKNASSGVRLCKYERFESGMSNRIQTCVCVVFGSSRANCGAEPEEFSFEVTQWSTSDALQAFVFAWTILLFLD